MVSSKNSGLFGKIMKECTMTEEIKMVKKITEEVILYFKSFGEKIYYTQVISHIIDHYAHDGLEQIDWRVRVNMVNEILNEVNKDYEAI